MNTKPSFWQRQFTAHPTSEQIVFDIAFGIVAPIICLMLDAGMLRLVSGPRFFVYTIVTIGLGLLCAELSGRVQTQRLSGIVTIVLLLGVICSFGAGLLLLPLSLFGILLAGIGLLGFIPFIVSFVFLRNGIRACRRSLGTDQILPFVKGCVIGLVLIFAVPGGVEWSARTAWPDVEQPPIYPQSQNVEISRFNTADSGTAMRQTTTFTTTASEKEVEAFYAQTLAAGGWSQSTFGWEYTSASGKQYDFILQYWSDAKQPAQVEISLRYPH